MVMIMKLVVITALQCLLMGSVEASSSVYTAMSTYSTISSLSADSLNRPSVEYSLNGHDSDYISASLSHQFEIAGDANHGGLQNLIQNAQVFAYVKMSKLPFS